MTQPTTNFPTDLIITSQGFGLLRKALIENMGLTRANHFLFRFGQNLGASKAKELQQNYASVRDLVKIASDVHISLGHISGVESLGKIISAADGSLLFKDVHGKWFDSFEAALHLEHFGTTDYCTCYTLSGFASGYLSAIYDQDIYILETSCQSMGHAHCCFDINDKQYWLAQDPTNPIFQEDATVLKELSLTYDTLLTQKRDLNKMLTYHSELSECVVKEDGLNHVLSKAFDILHIPIVLKNANDDIITCRGIKAEQYTHQCNGSKKHQIKQHHETIYNQHNSFVEMTTSIKLDSKKFATCSFLYDTLNDIDDNDYVFLERLASVATLCFMKEKIRFETTERLKISVLDQLIQEGSNAIHSAYVTNNIHGPFHLLKIKLVHTQNPFEKDPYNQLIQLAQMFRLFYIDILATTLQHDIIVLIYNSKPLAELRPILKKIIARMHRNHQQMTYKIGVSNEFSSLIHLKTYVQQAAHAVNLPRHDTIIAYEELGILGSFLSNTNVKTIQQIAKDELKELLYDDVKYRELLHTLYVYLINGKHLEKTMHTLSLSMGGIQYRIRKIEEVIGKNLKDFYTASSLLLLIESLLTIGELDWSLNKISDD